MFGAVARGRPTHVVPERWEPVTRIGAEPLLGVGMAADSRIGAALTGGDARSMIGAGVKALDRGAGRWHVRSEGRRWPSSFAFWDCRSLRVPRRRPSRRIGRWTRRRA